MPVSLYGQTADFDCINEIADRYGLIVIEDALKVSVRNIKIKNHATFLELAVHHSFQLSLWVVMEMAVQFLLLIQSLQKKYVK